MATVEEKYLFTTPEESVLNNDWAAGSRKIIDSNEYVIERVAGTSQTYTAQYKKVSYPPAWLKTIDEPIVNALDHFIRCLSETNNVTWIKVIFDKTGRIKISNNGPGIEVAIHKVATEKFGTETWIPEFIFGELFQGSNRKKNDDSIIGGTNGLGSKLSNLFSTEFLLETVDGVRKLYYFQRWRNQKQLKDAPMIVDLTKPNDLPAERKLPHTTLSFMPDYQYFGYEKFDESVYKDLVDIVRTRVIFASAYAKGTLTTGNFQQKSIDIYFNDEKLNINNMADIAKIIFPNRKCVQTVIIPEVKARSVYHYPWEVCAIIANDSNDEIAQINQLSNVNGIVVREGKHTKYLFSRLVECVKDKIVKIFKDKNMKFSPSYITNNVFLFVNAKIPHPSWTGQRKDILDLDVRKLSGYVLDKKFVDGVSDRLKTLIIDEIFNEKEATKRTKSVDFSYDKYHPATKSSSKKEALKCALIAVEGDSAMGQICTGISNNKNMGFEYYGVISLGGVITNARKECTIDERANGERRIKQSTKLIENLFMNALKNIVGLNINYRYDPQSPTYKKEMSELHYGHIIACVDQDYDGVGNIYGLLINIFELFWPNLLNQNYVKRFETPKIRAYPKRGGKAFEFYSDEAYDDWAKCNNDRLSDYAIGYYKGLGTHSREEIIHMFKNFHKHLFTYDLDDRSHELFEIYFGNNPDLRKVALATPVTVPSPEKIAEQLATMRISCSDHLDYETKTYQKDSIERHLDHAIDGFNQSARMIYDGAHKAFQNSDKKMKVAQLAGFISEHENYHHGEESLAESITGKAFINVGGKQLPQLLPYGNFGTRLKGGEDAAQARYIWVKFNKRAMNIIYPEIDYWMLDFTFDEGVRGTPKYYLPIIPMSIIESTELPGHGWKLKTWGRDVFKVIDNVRRLIRLDDNARLLSMPPYIHGWNGQIRLVRGEPYSFGVYEYDSTTNRIKITELPLRVWTDHYVEKIRKKIIPNGKVIHDIIYTPDDRTVNIVIILKPGAIDWLIYNNWGDSVYTDPIEEYFMLRDHMLSHLNMIGSRGEVIEFSKYEDIISYWFPFRKHMYMKRIDRQRKLLSLEIIYYENIIRYINDCIKLNIVKKKLTEMNRILQENNYVTFAKNKLMRPKFTPTDELENIILRGPKSNYDYLLDLTDRKKSEEALIDWQSKLDEKIAELNDLNERAALGRFEGASIWENELDKLESVIKEGQQTEWKFDEKDKYMLE